MKNHFALILVALATSIFFGCNQQNSSSNEERIALAKAEVKRVDIPLDEHLLGVKASLARNFYFIFDGSGSMEEDVCGDGDQTFGSKIAAAKLAVHEFMKKIDALRAKNVQVNLGLYVFDYHHEEEVVPLSGNNRDQFLKAIDAVYAKGGTPLTEAIIVGVDKLVEQYKRQLGYGEYRLVVVTDGEATEQPIKSGAFYAIKYGIPIYTIGFCMDADHTLRLYSASYRTANSTIDLAKGLEETLAESEAFDPTEF